MKTKNILTIAIFVGILTLGFVSTGFAVETPPPVPEGGPKPVAYPWVIHPELFGDTSDTGDAGPADFNSLIEPRVIGGSAWSPPEKYPWLLSQQNGGFHYCAGILITPDWYLTSAHCWTDISGYEFDITPFDTAVLGEYDLASSVNEQAIAPGEIYRHPAYDYMTFEYDLALVRLSSSATLNTYVDTINLVSADPGSLDNTPGGVAGWGAIDRWWQVDGCWDPVEEVSYDCWNYTYPQYGQDAVVNIWPNWRCSIYGAFYKKTSMLCGGVADFSIDACKGDSGGPIFYDDGGQTYVAGVTSWGYGCAEEGYPGVYARVSTSRDWIDWVLANYGTSSSHDDISTPKVIPSHPYQDIEDYTIFNTGDVTDPDITACNLKRGENTVWYQYTPSESESFYVETLGSTSDTFVAVWTGTPGSLSPVVCNDDYGGTLQSKVLAFLNAGTTYYIEVGLYNGLIVGEPSKPNAVKGGKIVFSTTTFEDVAGNHAFYPYIEAFYDAGITAGCSVTPLKYCPTNPVNRQQMAVFILRAMYGPTYTPPTATGIFADVPDGFFKDWIEQFYIEGITGGCKLSPLSYCPKNSVTREQMAIFILRAKHGPLYTPPPATGIFADVPDNVFKPWIEAFYNEGITGGCKLSPLSYCPKNVVTRGQMAVFIDRGFGITPIP